MRRHFFFWPFFFVDSGETDKTPKIINSKEIRVWDCCLALAWPIVDRGLAKALSNCLCTALLLGHCMRAKLKFKNIWFFEKLQWPKPLAGQGWVMAAATDAQKRKSPFTRIGCACRVLVAWPHDSHFVAMFDQRPAIAQPRFWTAAFWGAGWSHWSHYGGVNDFNDFSSKWL